MGEAKRRKKLDPMYGKRGSRSKQEVKPKSSSRSLTQKRTSLENSKIINGRLPQKYINVIANEEWHSTELPPEEKARMEDQCIALGLPLATMDWSHFNRNEDIEVVISLAALLLGEQMLAFNNASPDSEITDIVKELAFMILSDSDSSLSGQRSPFLDVDGSTAKVRELGEKLYKKGGTDLMLLVGNKYVPRCDQRSLELIWHLDWRLESLNFPNPQY